MRIVPKTQASKRPNLLLARQPQDASVLELGDDHSLLLRPLLARIEDAMIDEPPKQARGGQSKPETLITATGQKFYVGGVIGAGSFGQVRVVATFERGMRKIYALKSQKVCEQTAVGGYPAASDEDFLDILREVELMRQARSTLTPTRLFLTYTHPSHWSMDMLMPLMETTLSHLIEQFSANAAQGRSDLADCVYSQLAGALADIHGRGVQLLDIKPDNILIDRTGLMQFCDFGLSTTSKKGSGGSGTLTYMAPEELLCWVGDDPFRDDNTRPQTYDNKAAGLWQFGVTLAQTLGGTGPFMVSDFGDHADGAAEMLAQTRFVERNVSQWTQWPQTRSFEGHDANKIAAYPAFWLATYMQNLPRNSHTVAATFALLHPEPKKRALLAPAWTPDALAQQRVQLQQAVACVGGAVQREVRGLTAHVPAKRLDWLWSSWLEKA